MYKINGMLFNKNKELRKNQRLIDEFLGTHPTKSSISYDTDWNKLIIVYKQIGDILFDDLTSESEIQLIEKSFDDLDYWIMSGDIKTAYEEAILFIKKYFDEEEEKDNNEDS